MTSVQPLGRRDGLGIEFHHVAHDSINHAYIMERSMNSRHGGLTKLPQWAMHIHIPGISVLGALEFHVWGPSRPCPMSLFLWLVFICILSNKTEIISISLS